jgi:hypothetical protein
MTRRVLSGNVGEWSELYAFLKILYDGMIYAADENANKIDTAFLEVLKIVREEKPGNKLEYRCSENIQIWRNEDLLAEIDKELFTHNARIIFSHFFIGRAKRTGSFIINDVSDFLDLICVNRLRAPSAEKIDISLQVNDIRSGQKPTVGFSIKSDVGALPTLLNSGHNTRFRYKINGMSESLMTEINSLTTGKYLINRMKLLSQDEVTLTYSSMHSTEFEQNLSLIDMRMPEIYAELILIHYRNTKLSKCVDLIAELTRKNPLKALNTSIYNFKFKKLLVASALGMTPGTSWNGIESATGGYLIVKKDGDVLFYHLYNRNLFEDYLLNNTKFDRPGMHRYDYGYVFRIGDEYFIDFNIQIRFRSINRRCSTTMG